MKLSPIVLPRHFMMLKYWHKMAHQELKDHYRLPEVGESIEGLQRRNLSESDLKNIEGCYHELRESFAASGAIEHVV